MEFEVGRTPPVPLTGGRRSADPRPARTRAAILAAVERLPGLPPDQVTVAAIARDAGVSRSAFYTQFSGLEELLSASLSEAARSIDPGGVPSGARASRRDMARASLSRLVAHIDARATFFTAAIEWKLTVGAYHAALEGYEGRVRQLIDAVRASAPTDPRIPPATETDIVAPFIAGGLMAAMTAWLRTGQATPKADLVEQLLKLLPGWLTSDENTTISKGG